MQRGSSLCLMAPSSVHPRASHHEFCPSMDLSLVAFTMLKGSFFNMLHVDILIFCREGQFNELSIQMLFSVGRSRSTSVINIGSGLASNLSFSGSMIISSILWHSSTLKCCSWGSCWIMPLENTFFSSGHLINCHLDIIS